MSNHWTARSRPERLEARFEFADYQSLRDFLDQAADLSEREALFPDISFGRTYVNMTIHADSDGDEVDETRQRFAEQIAQLYQS
jgi:pterin-4a-carbinolamine dehydratase